MGERVGWETREIMKKKKRGVGGRIGERESEAKDNGVQVFCFLFPFINTGDGAAHGFQTHLSSSWQLAVAWGTGWLSEESLAVAEAEVREKGSDMWAVGWCQQQLTCHKTLGRKPTGILFQSI